ncbi:MAG: class I SAM-dependent methyltransferase [Proteobacteria bacterium]|nr:class I SAM-dependent methyltransferase [Pseudomonadota bacterium]
MPEAGLAHGSGDVSPWVRRWSHLVPAGATVLDVACGSGRHVRWFAGRGCRVTGVDRDTEATAALAGVAEIVVADIEAGPWPFAGRRYDAVIVTNYLWRALLPTIVASVADGGVLLYETFAIGNETVGRPANPKFLLQPGELLAASRGLRVVAYEDGWLEAPPRYVQRVAAVRETAARGTPPRYPLRSPGDAG